MTRAFIGIGSNLGARAANLRVAVERLAAVEGVVVAAASPVYENPAVGMDSAGDFLNAAVELRTFLEADSLLDCCLGIEREMGRVRAARWTPRTIDLDILYWGGGPLSTERLTVPHPRLLERAFVVVPLADLVPELEIAGRRLGDVAATIERSQLSRLTDFFWPDLPVA